MNRATRIIVATLGALLGFAGMDHGLCEALQGNTPTGSLLIGQIVLAEQRPKPFQIP